MHLKMVFTLEALSWLPEPLAERVNDLNRRIAEHEKSKEALIFRAAEVQEGLADVATVNLKKLESAADRARPFELAQTELLLRREWNALDDDLRQAAQVETAARDERLREVKQEIARKLESISKEGFSITAS